MKYTAAHWGSYHINKGDLAPLANDPSPSRIGKGWVSAARDPASRILRPAVRKGWLDGDKGAARCDDGFVEVSWDEALDLAANALRETQNSYGDGAIYGGSYGWASAGRFHHAQSHLRRFLNLIGGCVTSTETYSHAAAEVLFPHILGLSNRAFQDEMTSLSLVAEHCELLLAIGGLSGRTAQVASSGTSFHEVPTALDRMAAKGVRMINVSPRASDMAGAEWLSIRPGTDTALLLALTQEIVAAGREDAGFLARCTSGWEDLRAYLAGQTDGIVKNAAWASPICDISAQVIVDLAQALTEKRSMISVAWGIQRAEYGEQPLWATLALACVIGQIGQAGTGFGFGYGSTSAIGRDCPLIPWPSLPQGVNPIADHIPVARIADMLLHPGGPYPYNGTLRHYPDIKLVWWAGGNPFHHHQDLNRLQQAWTRPETVIVNEHSWTATARRSDIVFPVTTPLEREDIMINRRDPSLIWMSRLLDPMGEARDDFAVFSDMAARMGVQARYTAGRDAMGWLRHLWMQSQNVAREHGFALPDFDRFRSEGRFDVPIKAEPAIAFRAFVEDPARHPLATETGRLTLTNGTIAAMGLTQCAGHPTWTVPQESLLTAPPQALHLISPQPDTRLHAQNDRGAESLADKIMGREAAYLHPNAAAARGLSEGMILRIFNARGACLAGLRLDAAMREDCTALPTGAWFDPQGAIEVHGNPNVLTRDAGCSDLSQGNIAHSALVQVEAWTQDLPDLSISRPPAFLPR